MVSDNSNKTRAKSLAWPVVLKAVIFTDFIVDALQRQKTSIKTILQWGFSLGTALFGRLYSFRGIYVLYTCISRFCFCFCFCFLFFVLFLFLFLTETFGLNPDQFKKGSFRHIFNTHANMENDYHSELLAMIYYLQEVMSKEGNANQKGKSVQFHLGEEIAVEVNSPTHSKIP